MSLKRLASTLVALSLLSQGTVATARADAAGSPTEVIAAFHQTLLAVMKDATKLGYQGRYKLLEPAIDKTFDLPLMTRIVVGSPWNDWTEAQRQDVIAAFSRFVVSTYARRFDGYSGESFKFDEARPAANGTLVKTEVIRPHDTPVTLTYLVEGDGDAPSQVIDVFLTGTISELATRRSEFGAILRHDGYDGLLKVLAEKSDENQPP
jgi:phospholipid transport system substrate-binding protein